MRRLATGESNLSTETNLRFCFAMALFSAGDLREISKGVQRLEVFDGIICLP
jgi:hypothetical protein